MGIFYILNGQYIELFRYPLEVRYIRVPLYITIHGVTRAASKRGEAPTLRERSSCTVFRSAAILALVCL